MKKVIAAAVLIVAILVLAFRGRWEQAPPAPVTAPPRTVPAAPAPVDDAPSPPPGTEGPSDAPAPPPADPELSANDSKLVHAAIDNLGFTLRDYGNALGGNPVGTNAEITAALSGDNAKQLKLELPAGSTLNAAAELCDPWGTPWFFHQLGSNKTELRSAGPDRKLYTDDDFVR